jgi:hypothetical protein
MIMRRRNTLYSALCGRFQLIGVRQLKTSDEPSAASRAASQQHVGLRHRLIVSVQFLVAAENKLIAMPASASVASASYLPVSSLSCWPGRSYAAEDVPRRQTRL